MFGVSQHYLDRMYGGPEKIPSNGIFSQSTGIYMLFLFYCFYVYHTLYYSFNSILLCRHRQTHNSMLDEPSGFDSYISSVGQQSNPGKSS